MDAHFGVMILTALCTRSDRIATVALRVRNVNSTP